MKINPYMRDMGQKEQKLQNTQKEDLGFAKTLEEFIGTDCKDCTNHEKQSCEFNSPEYLQERIEHYQSTATTEDHETYINMMKYFKENWRGY